MLKLNIVLAMISLFTFCNCPAQFADDFSDGDFSLNPTWQGDQSRFTVVNGQLKLQAPASTGSAFLVTASQAVYEAVWSFVVHLDFNPSSSNFSKIYLMADNSDLLSPRNGYFVRVGHSTREVSLFVQSGNTEVELIDGLDDRVNLPLVNLSVRVTRSASGAWDLFTDVGLTGKYSKEGAAIDATHTISTYFGFQCFYTSTRSDKFWFDNVVVTGSVVPDTSPPKVEAVETLDSIRFQARFSEPLEAQSATTLENVLVDGYGSPYLAILKDDQVTVEWTLHSPLVNGVSYQVRFSDIADRVGNKMTEVSKSLLFFRPGKPTPKAILLMELFPDPTPQQGLPLAEYIELYNRGTLPFELKDWKLSDGSSVATFPSTIILPKTFWIITSATATGLFQGNVIGLSNFPSLNNSGDVVTLKDPAGLTIDSLSYTLAWYRDEDKAEGGWSLELIDPDNPCGESENWTASEDKRGGTPGIVNSVLAHKPDLTPPSIENVLPIGASRLFILFNESLLRESLPELRLSILPEVPILGIFLNDPARRKIEVELFADLKPRIEYRVEARGIRDCNSNPLESSSFDFGLAEPGDSLDIIISEVLFNPKPGGVDFVELYNASDKFIDLADWFLQNDLSRTALPRRQLHPHQFIVLTENQSIVQMHYPNAITTNLATMDLPSLPDDFGRVLLTNDQSQSIDQLNYNQDWHSEFLKSDEGVSLERIAFDAPTQEHGNWISASSLTGYATPGFANSQQRTSKQGVQEVEIIPEIFSPGTAAFDFVQIGYRFDRPGRVANVIIFNQQGVIIKRICNNEILGSEGFLRWDGDQDDGVKAHSGFYVVWFETFEHTGRVSTFRKRVVISNR